MLSSRDGTMPGVERQEGRGIQFLSIREIDTLLMEKIDPVHRACLLFWRILSPDDRMDGGYIFSNPYMLDVEISASLIEIEGLSEEDS